MSIVYVGLDLGSSVFHQVAIRADGVTTVNRDFATSEANLKKAFSDLRGEIHVHLEAGELAPWGLAGKAKTKTVDKMVYPVRENSWNLFASAFSHGVNAVASGAVTG